MKRILAVVLPALLLPALLSACSSPLVVPEAGPNAPGFTYPPPAPPPPRAEVVTEPIQRSPKAGGAVDTVERGDGSFTVSGWAFLATTRPRGVLRVVLPQDVDAEVQSVVSVRRPDVVEATGSEDNSLAGFIITLEGTLPGGAGVCVQSRSSVGTFTLDHSDEALCPS